ncbi:molybdopterin-binding protein [Chelatococcus sp. SYSU_G07232]|uniref:Molybdopterin-binding protein n=1 Tax=Chelatococcus albus TaxID=3047466 RepID=A0ABT7AG86_9HYPH|nr:molybdopterin-binding protein [Chelatococcus sp. SYSU_G07232]MDJ1158388.1 molybdopterin-binding protein [Chelatococcus sp. SYSU_G07232]
MKFGPLVVDEAEGAIAAHSVRVDGLAIKKGKRLTAEDVMHLRAHGVATVTVARLEPGDVGEDEAALSLAGAIAGPGVRVEAPFTGRSNLFAGEAGVLVALREAIDAINTVDEAVTVATLPAYKPVVAGEMVATVKIIPYAISGEVLQRAEDAARAAGPALSVAPYRLRSVGVVSTRLPGLKESVIDKTLGVLTERLAPSGAGITEEYRTPHEAGALAAELTRLARSGVDLLVVFGASAVADRKDVVPAAIEAAGGRVHHLGMPVDPGNLLLIGELAGKPVIGAPGCARSPKENGFDWVLHRLLAGLAVTRADIMALGVGGLLMEIVSRPQPRAGGAQMEEDGEPAASPAGREQP